eukprot:69662_1
MMNYFTPTQERIAIVETASYNQKLLALRARRLAQQRMDFAHRIATMNKEYYTDQNYDQNETEIYLGPTPQITEQSDDEDYEIDEIFTPVPYQKGYWIHAQKQAQAKQKKAQQQKQNNNNKNNNKPQNIQRSISTTLNKPIRSQYQYPYSNTHKKPEYRPAAQYHPSYKRNTNNKPSNGPPGLV